MNTHTIFIGKVRTTGNLRQPNLKIPKVYNLIVKCNKNKLEEVHAQLS